MKKNNIYWGALFLIIAAMIILSGLGLIEGIGIYSLIFTVFWGAVLLDGIVKFDAAKILFSIAFLCIVWDEQLHIESITPWPILLAAALGSIGLSMIFGGKRRHKFVYDNASRNATIEEDGNQVVRCESRFSATVKYVTSDNLQQVIVKNEFSGMSIYLDKAIVPNRRLEVFVNNSFGGIDMYIPSNWIVENNLNSTFGGIDEEGRRSATDSETVTLVLTGKMDFGGITIKYI